MKKVLLYLIIAPFIYSCSNSENVVENVYKNMVVLRSDTINVVKLTDSLIIYQNACRGCAFEESTHFDINDSTGIIELAKVVTTDNSPDNMNGGSVNKDLILVPVKEGITKMKLYKFINENPTAKDSALFTTYTIEVRN